MAEEEDAPVDIDMDVPIGIVFNRRKKLKTKRKEQVEKKAASDGVPEGFVVSSGENRNGSEFPPGPEGFAVSSEENRNGGEFPPGPEGFIVSSEENRIEGEFTPGITVSLFDYSVENHFRAVDTISRICGESVPLHFDPAEIRRLSTSILFLREWRQFSYPSKTLRFLSQNQTKMGSDFMGAVTLPQFSSAAVPKQGAEATSESSKDFVMNVGGLVSALDWCPRVDLHSNSDIRSEFIAVAAHPPEANYHKIGAPVVGRGMVQVWCVLNLNMKKSIPAKDQKKQKRTNSKREVATIKSPEQKRQRGRPRKHPVDVNNNSAEQLKQRLTHRRTALINNQIVETPVAPSSKESSKLLSADSPTVINFPDTIGCDSSPSKCSIPNDVALPRLVFCLAHNGKVAWDVKWRPSGVCDKQRMGYLAVLLGNGALEVWEVPFPQTVKAIYAHSHGEATDPRFIKLQPVFRCSIITCGDRQSIPLSLEWSTSYPHDQILAGCHDGVVALWKFCNTSSLEETRPILCFSADTVPIRALSWAPVESSSESSNVFVTGGHKGLKFWDLRDPFRPLWELNPIQQIIYSLDWLPDPRCIIVASDDGALWILGMSKAACDVAVTGKPFAGTQQQGFHSYYCSQYPIWSVHTSRLTGMVAYCGADGTALRFQLNTRAVERDPLRNRAPHYLCGMLNEEESGLTMFTPLPNIPFPMKKSDNEWSETPRTKRGFCSSSNQEKRAKEKLEKGQTSEVQHQPLALCYGSDSGVEFGTNDKSLAPTSKRATKTTPNRKKKLCDNGDDDQLLLLCGDENPGIVGGDEEEGVKKFEEFPPKKAAMHRVRWNGNVGSENWLCYGGAAGVLRCQEMDACGV